MATLSPGINLNSAAFTGFARERERNQLIRLCQFQLVTTIVFSRLAIPFGSKQIQMTWVVGALFFALIAFKTGCAFSRRRVIGLTAIGLVTAFESTLYHFAFSPLSLFYLFGIYGPLCLSLPFVNVSDLQRIWKTFITLTVIMAACGLLQVVVQLVARSTFVDPLGLLPESVQLSGYTTVYRTSIGSFGYVKPNGMFALEPSFFSQFLALGIVGELTYFRRKKVIAILGAALLTSFAGTGILILLLAIPFIKQSPRWIVLMLAAGLLWKVTIGDQGGGVYASRLQEFETHGASGNARFVFPYQVMWDWWQRSGEYLAIGIGAGQSSTLNTIYEANFAPVAKAGLEFGLIGLCAFCIFWFGMYFKLALPAALTAALFAFYFIASGALLHPPTVFPIWTLTLGFLPSEDRGRSI